MAAVAVVAVVVAVVVVVGMADLYLQMNLYRELGCHPDPDTTMLKRAKTQPAWRNPP